ncbi:MAG: hypothetical protein U0263_00820 [Polyangiaceae bacterium]
MRPLRLSSALALLAAAGCADDVAGLRIEVVSLQAPSAFDARSSQAELDAVLRVQHANLDCARGCRARGRFEIDQGGGIPVRRLVDEQNFRGATPLSLHAAWDGRDDAGRTLAPDTFSVRLAVEVTNDQGETLVALEPDRNGQLADCRGSPGCAATSICPQADAAPERCEPVLPRTEHVCDLVGGFLASPPITAWNFKGTGDKPPLRMPFAFQPDDRYPTNAKAGGNPENGQNPLVAGTDLGSPFARTLADGKRELVFLFGDTQPIPVDGYAQDQSGKIHPTGSPFLQPPSADDSLALSHQTDDDPPTGPERCLDLEFAHGGSELDPAHGLPKSELIAPITLDGVRSVNTETGASRGPELGSSRIPGPGFDVGGRALVLVPTSADPSVGVSCDALHPCPAGDVCGQDGVCRYGDCSALDGSTACFKRNAPATLAHWTAGATLHSLATDELGSAGALDVYREAADLIPPVAFFAPDATQVYVWGRRGIAGHPDTLGTPQGHVELRFWRHAFAEVDGMTRILAPEFFAGCIDSSERCDEPRFSPDESDARPVYAEDRIIVNQTSVTFLPEFGRWVMIYGGRLPLWTRRYHPSVTEATLFDPYVGIYLRTARHPWGPWSDATTIYDPYWSNVPGYCELLFASDQGLAELEARFGQEFVERSCDRSATVQLDRSRPDELGTEYGSAIVPAFYRDEPERASFFWLLSTWNPYRVVLMKTQLVRPPG